jgi:hypothetical protein
MLDAATAAHIAITAGNSRAKEGPVIGIFLSWVMEPAKKADASQPFLSNFKKLIAYAAASACFLAI